MRKLSKEELILALAIVFKDAGETPKEKDLLDRAYRQIDSLLYELDKLPPAHPYNIELPNHYKAETVPSEYDAGPYWGLSGMGE